MDPIYLKKRKRRWWKTKEKGKKGEEGEEKKTEKFFSFITSTSKRSVSTFQIKYKRL